MIKLMRIVLSTLSNSVKAYNLLIKIIIKIMEIIQMILMTQIRGMMLD